MTRTRKLTLVAIALASLGLSANAASAASLWQLHHPRRGEVNARLAHQDLRINHALRTGALTPWQARRLHRADHIIRHEERAMARFNGGYITPHQQRMLNRQENLVSRHIGY